MREDRSLDEFFPASDEENDADGENSVSDADGENSVSDADGENSVSDADGENSVSDADGENDSVRPVTRPDEVRDADEAEAGGEADDASTDLPRATYRWSPDGEVCPVCGVTVEQQWRDGDQFVCADCKEW